MRSLRIRQIAALAGTTVMIATLAACGGESLSQSAPGTGAGSAVTTTDLNSYNPKAVEFFSSFAINGRAVESDKSIADAVTAATAVVVGSVLRVELTRVYQGEVPDDRLGYIGIVIRPEVLAGSLPSKFENELTVEFTGDPNSVKDLAATLPVGHQALWFLHQKTPKHEANYFRVVSPQGLFVQGEHSVATPLDEVLPGATNLAADGRKYPKLSDLVDAVRNAAKAG